MYILQLFYLFLFLTLNICLNGNEPIIVIYGSSCSGKSSLSKALKDDLGENWTVIDRDLVIEKYCQDKEELADAFLLDEIRDHLNKQKNLIVDTQDIIAIEEDLKDKQLLRIFVYAPLSIILARDSLRAERLNRSPKRNYYARSFVLDSYAKLLTLKSSSCDPLDVIRRNEVDENLLEYALSEEAFDFFRTMVFAKQDIFIYPNRSFQIILESHIESLNNSVRRISDFLKCSCLL